MESREADVSSRRFDRGVAITVWGLCAIGIIAAIGLFVGMTAEHFNPFWLRINWYLPLSLIPMIVSLVAFVLIVRVKARIEGASWFAFFLLGTSIWSGSEIGERFGATTEISAFWAAISSGIVMLGTMAYFLFALSYTHPQKARNPVILTVLLTVGLTFLYFDYRWMFFYSYEPTHVVDVPWGHSVVTSQEWALYVRFFWMALMIVSAFVLFWLFYRKTIEPNLRRQARLVALACIAPFIATSLTDWVIPLIDVTIMPSLAVVSLAFTGAVTTYGILKYRFFTFSVDSVANNIISTMNEAVIGATPDFKITYINEGAERLFGYEPKQFGQLAMQDLLEDKASIALFEKALDGDKKFGTVDSVNLRRADGGGITAKVSLTELSGTGQTQGYLAVITDITEIARAKEIIEREVEVRTREARQARNELLSSINSLEQGFIMTDARPEVLTLNKVACKMFCGDSSEECRIDLAKLGESIGADINPAKEIKECLEKQKPRELKNITFHERNWRVYLSPIIDEGKSVGCAMLWQDVTEEWILERSRDEFFSIASHELRTPLTAIMGNSSMMLQYYKEVQQNPDLKQMADDIHESSERLIGIVNDFLDVSRLEQGKMAFKLEELDSVKVLENTVYEMGGLLRRKNLSLTLEGILRAPGTVPKVIADRSRVKQIMYNLIDNSAKHMKEGNIIISAEIMTHDLKITITDTGSGIPRELQPLLFHKFQQASESILTRDTSRSTGLGLYISRLMARGMGGDLTLVHSEPGKGSEFALRLPLSTPEKRKKITADKK